MLRNAVIVAVFPLLLSLNAKSQGAPNVSQTILESPYKGEMMPSRPTGNEVEGTPLLYDDWRSGDVVVSNGTSFHLDKINFDASNGSFVYSIHDTVYQFQSVVNQVTLDPSAKAAESAPLVFRNDLVPNDKKFYQLLTKGKVSVLRRYNKQPEGENYTNGIVSSTRKYALHTDDVALVDKKVIPVKYSNSSLQELTSDKKNEVESYIKSNNLKPKKEDDFLKSINYYNSIN